MITKVIFEIKPKLHFTTRLVNLLLAIFLSINNIYCFEYIGLSLIRKYYYIVYFLYSLRHENVQMTATCWVTVSRL